MCPSTYPAVAPFLRLMVAWPYSYSGKTFWTYTLWNNSQNKHLYACMTEDRHCPLYATAFSHRLSFSLQLMVSKQDSWSRLSRCSAGTLGSLSSFDSGSSSIITVYIMLLSEDVCLCPCPDPRATCKKGRRPEKCWVLVFPFWIRGKDIPECKPLD